MNFFSKFCVKVNCAYETHQGSFSSGRTKFMYGWISWMIGFEGIITYFMSQKFDIQKHEKGFLGSEFENFFVLIKCNSSTSWNICSFEFDKSKISSM